VENRFESHCVASQHLANKIRHFLNLPDFHSDAMFPVRRLGRVICGSSSTAALKNNQLVTNRADGEVDSWDSEAANFPIMLTRFMCAKSDSSSRQIEGSDLNGMLRRAVFGADRPRNQAQS